MLQRSCRLRKLVQQALVDASPVSADLISSVSNSRQFSSLPKDYASHRVVMPVRAARKAELTPQRPGPDAPASSSTTASTSTPASALQQGAQTGMVLIRSQAVEFRGQLLYVSAATSWMFPWEKRQMDGRGSPLRTWEKVYWGVFVTAISLFLFNRLKPNPQEAKVYHVLYAAASVTLSAVLYVWCVQA